MALEYRIVMSAEAHERFLNFEVRARAENPWRLFGHVHQHPADNAGGETFTLRVHERISKEVHAGVAVPDLETGLNMLLAMWQAHVQQLEAKK